MKKSMVKDMANRTWFIIAGDGGSINVGCYRQVSEMSEKMG